MTGVRHQKISTALVSGTSMLYTGRIDVAIIMGLGAVVGAIIPDLDINTSKASVKISKSIKPMLLLLISCITLVLLVHLGYVSDIGSLFLFLFTVSAVINLLVYVIKKKSNKKLLIVLSITAIMTLLTKFGYITTNSFKASTIKFILVIITLFIVYLSFRCASHRGPTHSLFIPIAGIIVTHYNIDINFIRYLVFGFWIGYLLHIFEDILNSKPTKIFWPVSKSGVCLGIVKYDGKLEFTLEVLSLIYLVITILIFMR